MTRTFVVRHGRVSRGESAEGGGEDYSIMYLTSGDDTL